MNAGDYTNSLGMTMVRVEPGSFVMGNDDPETSSEVGGPDCLPDGDWDERPVHQVRISYPFHMSAAQVTEEQYRQFDRSRRGCRPSSPLASGVSWYEAVAFCRWLSAMEGRSYRLPTEAEWEYACRAGSSTLFASGDDPPANGWANAWGLEGMHTGVAEWCLDWHGAYPEGDQVDPVGPDGGFARVVRGGGVHSLLTRNSPYTGTHPYFRRSANRAGAPPGYRGLHCIGLRIVEAPMPQTPHLPANVPFVRQCVRQSTSHVLKGPDPSAPYFLKRYLLTAPPENAPPDAVQASGLHPAILWHNHSPALEVCPNGDLLAIYFTASTPASENWANVALIASRLRFGSDLWDSPELFIDFPDTNDGPPLLWRDEEAIRLFVGGHGMPGVAFRHASSGDSGATWSGVEVVRPAGEAGPYSPQPINSAFRAPDGAVYVASDGGGNDSLLWVSRDDCRTWHDTGGRTSGRHTTFVLLKDGRILGLGGKHCSIDGYMARSISRDWGKTWEMSGTPFPALGGNQRPTIIRLASGRLFFASDFQHFNGSRPECVTEHGSFVALSNDEGETWRIKKLPGALPHEAAVIPDPPATLGYAVARQAPNGLIHLITSMNRRAMHFEINESWMLSDAKSQIAGDDQAVSGQPLREVERYPGGQVRAAWNACVAPSGRVLLDGAQNWYYENGGKQWEVAYEAGRKAGQETCWSPDGSKLWTWEHGRDGVSVWTQFRPAGQSCRSTWKDGECAGVAMGRMNDNEDH